MNKPNLQCPMPRGLDEWFNMFPTKRSKGCVWGTLSSAVIWELLKEGNRRIF